MGLYSYGSGIAHLTGLVQNKSNYILTKFAFMVKK